MLCGIVVYMDGVRVLVRPWRNRVWRRLPGEPGEEEERPHPRLPSFLPHLPDSPVMEVDTRGGGDGVWRRGIVHTTILVVVVVVV